MILPEFSIPIASIAKACYRHPLQNRRNAHRILVDLFSLLVSMRSLSNDESTVLVG